MESKSGKTDGCAVYLPKPLVSLFISFITIFSFQHAGFISLNLVQH